jgi:PTHB1 C-terminus
MVQVTVAATYLDAEGTRHCCYHTFCLPLALYVQMVPPRKSAAVRLTLTLDQAPPPVVAIFEDVAQSSGPQAASVCFHSEAEHTNIDKCVMGKNIHLVCTS